MLADLAQASGSDCTRHRTERGARQNQTMSKIGGGLFKYAPDEYSPRANRLPDADSRLQAAGVRLQGAAEQPNSRTIEDNRSTSFPSASSQCSLAVRWLYQRLSAYPGSLVGFAVRLVEPCSDRGMSRWHTSP